MGGHGWLFGAEGKSTKLNQHKTTGIIGRRQRAFDKIRKVPSLDEYFGGGGEGGDDSAAHRTSKHREVIFSGSSNVVVARFGILFSNFFR